MDNKITKKRIAIHLEYDWLKYLLVIAVCFFACYFLFFQINVTREHEKVDVFFACYRQNASLDSDFLNFLDTNNDTMIREVNITFSSPNESEYSSLFTTSGIACDVMVVSENDMKTYATWFLMLNDDIVSRCVPKSLQDKVEYYEYNESNAGDIDVRPDKFGGRFGIRVDNLVKINSENPPFVFDITKLEPTLTQEQVSAYPNKFYIVLLPQSEKIGEYGSNAIRHNQTQSFSFVHYFLEQYGNE